MSNAPPDGVAKGTPGHRTRVAPGRRPGLRITESSAGLVTAVVTPVALAGLAGLVLLAGPGVVLVVVGLLLAAVAAAVRLVPGYRWTVLVSRQVTALTGVVGTALVVVGVVQSMAPGASDAGTTLAEGTSASTPDPGTIPALPLAPGAATGMAAPQQPTATAPSRAAEPADDPGPSVAAVPGAEPSGRGATVADPRILPRRVVLTQAPASTTGSSGRPALGTTKPPAATVAPPAPSQPTAEVAPGPGTPVTQPPVTQPPVTQPPVTEAPVTDPPVTQPPVTEPPVTDPPVVDPPVTDPPVTDPPVVDPPVVDPPVVDPPITDPPITEAPVTEPPPV